MLESAEIGHKISKKTYARKEPQLREALLNAQFDLSRTQRGPVVIILSGVQAGGRGETANKLTEWMDPRHIRVVAFGPRTPEEAEHPTAWRYWRALPPKGRIGIFLSAWYNEAMSEAMRSRARARIDDDRLHSHLQSIREHEQMLTDEGAVLLKFWIHLSKAEQKARLKALEDDPLTRWRVTRDDWKAYRTYNKSHVLWEHLLRETSTGAAPVRGRGRRRAYRNLTVGKILLDAAEPWSRCRRERKAPLKHPVAPTPPSVLDNVKLIHDLDLSKKLPPRLQARVAEVSGQARNCRATSALPAIRWCSPSKRTPRARGRDPPASPVRSMRGNALPFPSPRRRGRRAQPYLWRFWRGVPPLGRIDFDRSGTDACWSSAWRAIPPSTSGCVATTRSTSSRAAHGRQCDRGQVLAADQQGRTAQTVPGAEHTPFKRFKITARTGAIASGTRTKSRFATWSIVPVPRCPMDPGRSRDKNYARIKILRTIVGDSNALKCERRPPCAVVAHRTARANIIRPCSSGRDPRCSGGGWRPSTAISSISTGSTRRPRRRPGYLIVLFHGLEGDSSSHYARTLMRHLRAIAGWRVVPHFRGCSGEPNLLPRAYRSSDFPSNPAGCSHGDPRARAVGVTVRGRCFARRRHC
jgi:polyphosphate kinase 2 (PPK2 family)